jgi:hypothetical protein
MAGLIEKGKSAILAQHTSSAPSMKAERSTFGRVAFRSDP